MYRQVKRAISLLLVIVLLFSLSCEAFAQTLVLPASLREIGDEAFYGDESLNEVVIPYGTEYIGERAFACSGLRKITIPETLMLIAPSAFDGLSDEFAICCPRDCYAYNYAMDHAYRWINSEEEDEGDIFSILDRFDTEMPDAEITIDEMTFDPLPTDGITDAGELQLIKEYNACQEELSQLYADFIQQRDVLVTALEEFEAFRQENVFEVTDGGLSMDVDGFSFNISSDITDLQEGAGILNGLEQEDGSILLEAKSGSSTAYLRADEENLSTSGALLVPRGSLSLGEYHRFDTPVQADSAVSRMRKIVKVLNKALTLFTELFGVVDSWVKSATAQILVIAHLEEAKYLRMSKLKISYGEEYLPAYRESIRSHVQAQRALKSIRAIGKFWGGLNITATLEELRDNLGDLDAMLALAEHGHPTAEDRVSELKIEYANKLNAYMLGYAVCIGATICYNLFNLVDSFMTLTSMICAAGGPAGWAVKITTTATVKVGKLALLKLVGYAAGHAAMGQAMSWYLTVLQEIDDDLHRTLRLYGYVYEDNGGLPLSDVRVSFDDDLQVTWTDENGMYAFPETASETHKLVFSKEGYGMFRRELEMDVTLPENEYIAFLPKDTAVIGTVTDAKSISPLAGVTVSLDSENDGSIYIGVTDADGSYAFPGMPAGSYRLSFSLDGYTAPDPVTINVNQYADRVFDSQLFHEDEQSAAPGGGPDFWQWCVDNLDTEKTFVPALGRSIKDGVLDQSEILGTNIIVLPSAGFTSLAGIERFQNLEYLDCKNNQLTSLNVSGLTKLNHLDCYNNQLTSLNISGCTSLRDLDCHNNQLTSLSFDGCVSLDNVDCRNNRLTELDHSGAPALTGLICQSNQLETLSLRGKSGLTLLECQDNRLTSIDVSGCTSLSQFWYERNPNLRAVNMSGCASLEKFEYQGSALTSVNASDCTSMTGLFVENNELTSLNVSGCTALTELYCYNNLLTGLNVSGCTSLRGLYCDNNRLKGRLDLSGHSSLEMVCCYNNALTSLDTSDSSISELRCENNALTNLNISGCASLRTLVCGGNRLKNLELSGLSALETVSCVDNRLTSLDCSGCTSLEEIDYVDNPISTLTFSGCTALRHVGLTDSVKRLILNGCSALVNLSLDDNMLELLNISDCDALEWLSFVDNDVKELILSGCKSLVDLYADRNRLWSINLVGCPKLKKEDVHCGPGVFVYHEG